MKDYTDVVIFCKCSARMHTQGKMSIVTMVRVRIPANCMDSIDYKG